jgi:DUF1680 family protein
MDDGKTRIEVEKKGGQDAFLRIRIPSWHEVSSYAVNGEAFVPAMDHGYAVVPLSGAGAFTVEIMGTVTPRFFTANGEVRADIGKLAVMYGPYVYCLEETDNGTNLASVFVSPESRIETAAPDEAMPGKLPTLVFDGMRMVRQIEDDNALYGAPTFEKAPTRLRAVPYCLWGNRNAGEMVVWMKAFV